ncbi:unnamed protein product [Trifolium pratense]|uniref:Uncharacterized protein n=1 Tax=Trifolium pratense TaxID=57577 RepID=A0ACB0JWE1_TRIPR|nr:unnamed protein product [Trifolium pratense]
MLGMMWRQLAKTTLHSCLKASSESHTVAEVRSLTKPFSLEEVKAAVWDCDSYKSPGPDGINFGFIKDFWAEMQGDVMRFISEFHRNGRLTKGLNASFIALTAFVQGRRILDGILVANEVVDEARKSKKELFLFKVDFEKAYDSVDWGYLDAVMGRMGFPTLWRKWIKECVCTATASVLVNGSPTDEFPLERGVRKGDPLSPFLFFLATEGLHVLMEAMVERNLFTGYSVGELSPMTVSHLQFADDTLLMGTKSWANVRALRAVLVLFESMSGLRVNFHKSMLVGVNIPDSWLGEAAYALCCKVGKIIFLYLGLPIGGDPRRLGFWEPVLDRLKKSLSGWRSRFLSFGGLLVLLKSVLTSLSVYALSFFKAPSGISGTSRNKKGHKINVKVDKKRHWIRWKRSPKEVGRTSQAHMHLACARHMWSTQQHMALAMLVALATPITHGAGHVPCGTRHRLCTHGARHVLYGTRHVVFPSYFHGHVSHGFILNSTAPQISVLLRFRWK